MTEIYNPKYLKHEQPQGQDAEDLEVFALVKGNSTRKVDASSLPPIAMDDNGNVFFTDPAPSIETVCQALWGLVLLGLAVLIGVFAVVFLIVTKAVNATVVSWLIVGTMAAFAIYKLKGEKRNAQQ